MAGQGGNRGYNCWNMAGQGSNRGYNCWYMAGQGSSNSALWREQPAPCCKGSSSQMHAAAVTAAALGTAYLQKVVSICGEDGPPCVTLLPPAVCRLLLHLRHQLTLWDKGTSETGGRESGVSGCGAGAGLAGG